MTIVTGLPLDLQSLAREIHQNNIAAGWWQVNPDTGVTVPRNIGELLALVHSEISEADEAFHQYDLTGVVVMDDKLPHRPMVEVELADTVIRVLDVLGYYNFVMFQRASQPLAWPCDAYWPEWCLLMHRFTTSALEGFRKGRYFDGSFALVDLLATIHYAALKFGYDLTGAIAEKRQFNRTRADHRIENRQKVGGKSF